MSTHTAAVAGKWNDGAVASPAAAADRGMSRWRWWLYALLARCQTSEQAYLRIPPAATVEHDVILRLCK